MKNRTSTAFSRLPAPSEQAGSEQSTHQGHPAVQAQTHDEAASLFVYQAGCDYADRMTCLEGSPKLTNRWNAFKKTKVDKTYVFDGFGNKIITTNEPAVLNEFFKVNGKARRALARSKAAQTAETAASHSPRETAPSLDQQWESLVADLAADQSVLPPAQQNSASASQQQSVDLRMAYLESQMSQMCQMLSQLQQASQYQPSHTPTNTMVHSPAGSHTNGAPSGSRMYGQPQAQRAPWLYA